MAISDTRLDVRIPGMSLDDYVALSRAPRRTPAQQWWNLPAKYRAAQRIKHEMLRDFPGHDDQGDALRHAELSRRLAVEIDPVTSALAGFMHEIDNSIPRPAEPRPGSHADENWWGQRWPERNMDIHNNTEGIRAALEGRPVDPANLQVRPVTPPQPLWPYGR
jgi:hypothetical protein